MAESADASSEPIGSLAEETAKLLRALAAERLNLSGDSGGHAGADAGESTGPDSGSPAAGEHVCTTGWCPICQVVGYFHDHPELVEQVAQSVNEAAVNVGRLVRDFLEKTLPPESPAPEHPEP